LDHSDLNRTQGSVSVHEAPSSLDDEEDNSTKASQTLQEGIEAKTQNKYGATSTQCKSELIRTVNKATQMDLYNELMDQEHFMLRSDIICHQEAIWEQYEIKSEKARNVLMGAAHENLRYFMPTLRKQHTDLKKCIDMYIDTLMLFVESCLKRKNRSRSGLEPLADSSTHIPAASMMAEVTTTIPNMPCSPTGPHAPVKIKPSVPSEQVRTYDPTWSNNHSETIRNNTVCSIAIEPHASLGPGLRVPGAQDVHPEDVRVEESIQSSTMNTSCERGVVHRTDDSQVCLAMPPVNRPTSVESECQDIHLDSENLITERGLDVHEITRKGKWSRSPDVNSSTRKNSDPHYSKFSSSLVCTDAQVTMEPGNPGLQPEDVGDGIRAGKCGHPPDIKQILPRNGKRLTLDCCIAKYRK
jgi:hypothetical protein